jgi:transcriptional regulator with XRE-family HTH domain
MLDIHVMIVNELDMRYAKKLKALRKSRGLKQFAIFGSLGLENQPQYSDLENGKKHFTDKLILNVCKYFRISVMEFVGDCIHSARLCNSSLLEDLDKIDSIKSAEVRLAMYKMYLLEAEIKIVETKLRSMHNEYRPMEFVSPRNSVYVII